MGISTALKTDKHLNEIKYQAAAADKELEQYLADAIA